MMSKLLIEHEKDIRRELRDGMINLRDIMHSDEFLQIKDSMHDVGDIDRDAQALRTWIANEASRRISSGA
jgi:hypothetical protein